MRNVRAASRGWGGGACAHAPGGVERWPPGGAPARSAPARPGPARPCHPPACARWSASCEGEVCPGGCGRPQRPALGRRDGGRREVGAVTPARAGRHPPPPTHTQFAPFRPSAAPPWGRSRSLARPPWAGRHANPGLRWWGERPGRRPAPARGAGGQGRAPGPRVERGVAAAAADLLAPHSSSHLPHLSPPSPPSLSPLPSSAPSCTFPTGAPPPRTPGSRTRPPSRWGSHQRPSRTMRRPPGRSRPARTRPRTRASATGSCPCGGGTCPSG